MSFRHLKECDFSFFVKFLNNEEWSESSFLDMIADTQPRSHIWIWINTMVSSRLTKSVVNEYSNYAVPWYTIKYYSKTPMNSKRTIRLNFEVN